jgi:hypothetical protein
MGSHPKAMAVNRPVLNQVRQGGRDFRIALQDLLDEGSLEGPPDRVESLVELAGGGWLRLTDRGHQRLDADA